MLSKFAIAALCVSLSACAIDYSKFPILDTKMWGNLEEMPRLYGNYQVTDASNFQNRIGRVEIYASDKNKPLFKLYDKSGKLLGGFSPRSCTLASDELSCGKSALVLGDYPYVSLKELPNGENYPPPPTGVFKPVRTMSVLPGGYRMAFRWDYQDRLGYLALQKLE